MTTSNKKRIAFLLGSGISNSVNMPSTKDITNKILSGKETMRATDGTYYLGQATDGYMNEYIDKATRFLNKIEIEIETDKYYRNNKEINYEDLYYFANQIHDCITGEYDNPLVLPFIEKIMPSITPLFPGKEGEHRDEWNLGEISYEAINYIKDIVWRLLRSKKPLNTNRLSIFNGAYFDKDVSNIDIFTLNHDTVLEDYLSGYSINLIDGFGNPENNVRYWNPELFKSEDSKVRLFKLHGSINWFAFCPDDGNMYRKTIGIPLDWDIWDTIDIHGQRQRPIDGRPMFLSGTFNKMLDYTGSIYAELYYYFYDILKKTNQLIICGYGFGDKGINRQIFEWVYSSPKHRLIIIHKDPEKLKELARPVLRKNWDELARLKKLQLISQWIENTTWLDIKKLTF